MSEETEVTVTELANRLAREAVKREMAKHTPYSPTKHTTEGVTTYCQKDGNLWPCPIVKEMSEAEEAINVAEEEEQRIANGPYYCGVQTRAARMYEDPEPAEYCEVEVEHEGQMCDAHEAAEYDDGRDDDAYDRWKDSRYDD
jgi:hypothetical protein